MTSALHESPQAQPYAIPRAWQLSDRSHQWQVYVLVQSWHVFKELQGLDTGLSFQSPRRSSMFKISAFLIALNSDWDLAFDPIDMADTRQAELQVKL
mmetsp:Transcript_19815/g.46396  ORF Transcript_19815/g.46396 Transcript_19815/m.46396 type:complete len:97 (-) Transcript_19815:61-351(-)